MDEFGETNNKLKDCINTTQRSVKKMQKKKNLSYLNDIFKV